MAQVAQVIAAQALEGGLVVHQQQVPGLVGGWIGRGRCRIGGHGEGAGKVSVKQVDQGARSVSAAVPP